MKTIHISLFLLIFVLTVNIASAEYWNSSWSAYSTVTMNATAPENGFQIHLSNESFTIPLTMWNEMNQDGNDSRIINYDHSIEFPFWIEHLTARDNYSIWSNVTDNTSPAYQWYYGNPLVVNNSNGDTTFPLFDDFEPSTADETYLTNWTKLGSNPIQNKTCQNWLIAVYSNYNNEDKIYIFEQRNAHPSNNIEAWSFTRDNASNSSNWTDHGVVFTGVSAQDDGHIEPHGIIFETQSLADAREGVGEGLGTPHWRIYYCGKGDGEGLSKYSENFIYAPENNLTNWTGYSNNPVYDHDAEWGFADPKVALYNDQVWMLHGKYKTGVSADPAFFSISDDGISNWADKTKSWTSERGVIGTLIPFSNGILVTGNPVTPDRYNQYFTTDGDKKFEYSGNPILSLGADGQWDDEDFAWNTIVIDKYGSANLSGAGIYYMYYIGYDGSTYRLGLATSTTLTEESEQSAVNASKWTSYGVETSTSGINIDTADEYIQSISTFQYDYRMEARMKINTYADYGALGFKTGVDTTSTDSAAYWFYATPTIKVVTDDPVPSSAYIEELGNLGTGWRTYEFIRHSSASKFEYLVDGGDTASGSTTDSNAIPTSFLPIQLHAFSGNPSIDLDLVFVRKHIVNESVITDITEPNFYVDSLHYNVSSPYNLTIKSDGTITSNRSIYTTDDTNWTVHSTGTTYWQHTTAITPAGNTNFTISGNDLDNFTATNLTSSTQYTLTNSSGTIEQQTTNGEGTVTFEVNLISGNYWISSAPVSEYIPPNPTSLANTTGNFWVNYTWSAGSGNVTDRYNVLYNGTWDNTSSNTYRNESVGAHGYLDITVYAYNNSGTGTLSASSVTDNASISNNAIAISGVSASYTLNEGETLSIDANYTDVDTDSGIFDDNSSVWNVDENTGLVSWVTSDGNDGTYNWYINVTDGYGSTDTQDFTVTVNDSIYAPTIEKFSITPDTINTNYTGTITISYLVSSSDPLNLSSLAFLYGLNYTIPAGGDMYNYISAPANDIAYDGIYRAPHRNLTPYLSWEDNATITEGNVWQWGGYDNDSTEVSSNAINATHTWVNVTGVTEYILPSSFYLSKKEMYDAPKTGFEVSRSQGLIFKMWNVEEIRNRDTNYLANMYFDTSWESTVPTDPIEIGYCNFSFDPDNDDIDVSPYCAKFAEWNGTRWVDHSYDPGANASYASPLTINASQFTDPIPTDINYVWLRSNTISSKSYILNATNYDPTITNITFAQTDTFWTYNELNGVTTAQAYTPSYFTTFARNYEELLHHLYIADDTGEWGHSEIFNESIGLSQVQVSPVSFEYFNVTCDESYHDEEMDATYDQGTIGVGLHAPADPDGGIVSHNLTLHYYPNQTLVAVLNNTFTTTGDEYLEIEVDTTSYYSSDTLYTLKCVSTDDEGSVATKWLISYFALDADGNRGWVNDDQLLFWGMNDIPTLYTEVNNNSMISYDGGDDVYTMHVPFFKSKANDTFTFDETVHLESLNNEDIAYFRFTGRILFDNATILGWNTTTDSSAPITDTYRSYVYSLTRTCGNITNSNFSYLGTDFYRQEGLNFVGNDYPYLIHNSTFSNNAEGPIFEECANYIISNCTIRDNLNVGIGVYFTSDFIIENNTIDSNAGYGGISVYEGFNNTIRYNDISNSGLYGIRFWSGAGNNTCTGNDITTSASYDYYYSGASFGNYLIDPASSTNLIRVTGTSSLNIENTDNAAFSEDSLNTSHAYLTNFSMYVTGVSQTFDITQHEMIITPSTDKLSIWNLEWEDTLTFNASSDTALNPTWYNITNASWTSGIVSIYTNGTFLVNETADINGLITYNYSDTYSEKWFEFQLAGITPTPTPTTTPTPTATATPPPSGGSSSGTGTTGVGTSDEPLYNIDCRETGRIRNLQAGTETYYRTTKPDCTDIIKVTFTPTQNSPEQPILIEKLHNKSRFVIEEAPHTTYSYFNLYVGLFGFDEKTTNEKLLFKVSKNWTEVNNVTPESVTLYIFDPSKSSWKSLPTTLSHTDTLYYVYESESRVTYGRFAIVGTDKVSLNIIEIITEKIEDILPSVNISESKFITGATSLYNDLKECIINLLPTSISFDAMSNIFDNENASTYIMAILTIILIAIISYFYNYEHGLIAGIIAIILMIIVTILQDTTLIKIMSVESGNVIISTIIYITVAFTISYILGEKLK